MQNETLSVRVTDSGETLEVVVLDKRPDRIRVVVGKGVHNVQCELTPTRNGQAYAGNVMGRELVYERSREAVREDLERLNPALKKSRRWK